MRLFPTGALIFPTGNFRRPAALARFVLVMLAGLGLDLWTKHLAFDRLATEPPRQVYDKERRRRVWVVELKSPYLFPANVAPRPADAFRFGPEYRQEELNAERAADPEARLDALRLRQQIDAAMGGYALVPGWLHFTVAVNEGAAMGIGQGWRVLFILISLAAIAFLTYLFAHSGGQRLYQVVLGMLLAGVLGNMYDRLTYHYVRDMIRAVPQWRGFFPWVFNVADVLLCCGVGFMLLTFVFARPRLTAPPSEAEQDESHLNVWT